MPTVLAQAHLCPSKLKTFLQQGLIYVWPALLVLNYDCRIRFIKEPSGNFEGHDLLLADSGGQ